MTSDTPPPQWDSRARRMFEIVKSGKGTAEEILALEFGRWPLPGAETRFATPTPIVFETEFHDEPTLHGSAISRTDRNGTWTPGKEPLHVKASLSLHPSYGRMNLSLLAHEAIHMLHWEAVNLDNFLNSFGRSEWQPKRVFNGLWSGLHPLLDPKHKEAFYVTSQAYRRVGGPNGDFPDLYYLQECEGLARLNSIFAIYAHIDSLSHGQKLKAMAEMIRTEQADPLIQGKALAQLSARELRENVVEKLSENRREEFYHDVLPRHFGKLLELLGNPQGQSQMGFEAGHFYARLAAKRISYEYHRAEAATPPWTLETWKELIAKVEPQTLHGLERLSCEKYHPRAHAALREATQSSTRSLPARAVPVRQATLARSTAETWKDTPAAERPRNFTEARRGKDRSR